MRSSPRQQAFARREAGRSPQQLRASWLAAIGTGQCIGDRLAAGDNPTEADHAALIVAMRGLDPGNFPVEAWSARQMAGAFLMLARTVVNPATASEARSILAPFMAAGAHALDAAMVAHRDHQARTWRTMIGERDD